MIVVKILIFYKMTESEKNLFFIKKIKFQSILKIKIIIKKLIRSFIIPLIYLINKCESFKLIGAAICRINLRFSETHLKYMYIRYTYEYMQIKKSIFRDSQVDITP